MKLRSLALLTLCVGSLAVAAIACGGKKSGGNNPTPTPSASPTGLVQAHAKILHGPSTTGASFAPAQSFAPPANGHWVISPDGAKLTIVNITFTSTSGNVQSADLTGCTPTYFSSSAALSQLADCPFSIAPGTYDGISIGISTTAELFVNDSINGFYTTTSAATSVSTTPPAGGAQFVKMVVQGPGGMGNVLTSGSFFPTSFTVDSSGAPSFDIIVDMIHTVGFDVSGASVTIVTNVPVPPASLVASLPGVTGRYQFYSGLGTAKNALAPGPTDNDSTGVRMFFAAPPQPTYIFHPGVGPSQAYSVDPRGGSGPRAGGWLGADSTGKACWAVPTDYTWSTYSAICEMVIVTNNGATTSVRCQNTTTPPPPTSGSTYASGCPAITPDSTANVTLVAH